MNQGRRIVTSKNGRTKDLLLRYPNFVAKSPASSFELTPLACEAGALTTELTARSKRILSGFSSGVNRCLLPGSVATCPDAVVLATLPHPDVGLGFAAIPAIRSSMFRLRAIPGRNVSPQSFRGL